ncbi:peptidoglycan/xylan/chitin deacetylase (PgdA/CDA1 family) [Bacillus oleivorans]|uniref:Peptidoglycan/xylan/chitin deacetylase (PgdA/CDA1 family) n=1 Tax=Bacillus oleivorans TaxID=1448271 RepID=A0A285D2H4_9BACI|nr:polysaccharide deacetylase family protein [Bacillus oleivorans]SNX73865.1 peptidoglycan/xylan/chitin deacetylase (PgdA/CDA1 family) [Bacillus oleivorans]
MKRFLFIFCLLGILTACSSSVSQNNSEQGEKDQTKPDQTEMEVDLTEDDAATTEPDDEPSKNGDSSEETEQPPAEAEPKPQYVVNPANWTIEPIDAANDKVVLLTFDDAPDEHAVEMAQLLKQLGVKAIFFVNGHFIDTEEEQQKLRSIHELGFSIGNHTYNHALLRDLTEEEQREDIVKLNELIENITGEKPQFFRAPHGVNTDYSYQVAEEEGMIVMNWTYGYDWVDGYLEKEALTDIMVNSPYLNNGANLLMHDRSWTFEALEGIVEGLRNKGYEFVDPATITKIEKIK